jgi:hypothetical protein
LLRAASWRDIGQPGHIFSASPQTSNISVAGRSIRIAVRAASGLQR